MAEFRAQRPESIRSSLSRLVVRSIAAAALLGSFCLCGEALAQGGQATATIQAAVSRDRVTVGEEFDLIIEIVTDGGAPTAGPTEPDLGGLKVVSGPATGSRTQIGNRLMRQFTLTYRLRAPAEGRFTIGPSEVEIEGETLKTSSIAVTVTPEDLSDLPPSLRDEPILNPKSRDTALQNQLKGRIFVRPVISDREPFVSEPIVVGYDLYYDPVLRPDQIRIGQPDLSAAIVDREAPATRLQPSPIEIDEARFNTTPLYQAVVTPPHAGRAQIGGFEIHFELPGLARSGTRDPFDFPGIGGLRVFGASTPIRAPAGTLELRVRPLPMDGMPPNFPGTVGSFTIAATVDRREASIDDVVTLKVTIAGSGNVTLAPTPEFPDNDHFALHDFKVENEWTDWRTLSGRKTIEYYLAPKSGGNLTVPSIRYPIFDPAIERYRELATETFRLRVADSGRTDDGSLLPGEAPRTARGREEQLHLIRPLGEAARGSAAPLAARPMYWAIQLLVLALAAAGGWRARWLAKSDPARLRRGRAGRSLERKLAAAREKFASGDAEGAALKLERALLEFVADRFNLSADGLTHEEAARLLGEAGLPEGSVARVREMLGACSQARYAPVGAGGAASWEAWTREAREMLAGGLK